MTSNWDTRWSKILAVVAEWSEDTSSKYGAIIVDKRQCLRSTGFNGIPRGIKLEPHYHNRPDKYNYFVHAEVNSILNSPLSVAGCTMYLLKPPCAQCAGAIINSGITAVKYLKHHNLNEDFGKHMLDTWRASIEDAESMLHEASVKLIHIGE
jgi:dCMP deaminase